MKATVLYACMIFFLLAANPVHTADKTLQLSITLEKITTIALHGKNFLQAEVKATFTNKSDRDRTFYLEDCGICFWQASINGGEYNPIKDARHSDLCKYTNSVTLKPGQSISRKHIVSIRGISRERDLKTLKIKYIASMEPSRAGDTFESNTIKH